MPRKKLIRSDRFPYHVTARVNNREAFPIALKFVWEIACDELYLLSLLHEVEIHGFVIMPNHIHLLITVPEKDLGQMMSMFLARLTRRVNTLTGRSGRLLGGPYFWSLITSTRYFGHVLKYVYRNPVKAGLCQSVEEYEFSTASGSFGHAHLPFPIYFTRLGLEINLPDPESATAWLEWLNRPFPSEAEKIIQKCLRKKEIKAFINRTDRKPYGGLENLV
jgi:putative transposase